MDINKLVKDGVTSLSGLEYIQEAVLKSLTPEERKEIEKLMKKLMIDTHKPSLYP